MLYVPRYMHRPNTSTLPPHLFKKYRPYIWMGHIKINKVICVRFCNPARKRNIVGKIIKISLVNLVPYTYTYNSIADPYLASNGKKCYL